MTSFTNSPLNYPTGANTPIKRVKVGRAPTSTDYRNFIPGDEWWDSSSQDWWKFVERNSSGAVWVRIGGQPGDLATLTGDSGGAVGPDGSHNINILGGSTLSVAGNPGTNTLTINSSSAGYPITPFVVGPTGEAGYQTIQAAVNAANAAGGGTVFIQPGTYAENITLFASINLWGYPGELGNIGIFTGGQVSPSVRINGTISLDISALGTSVYNTFTNLFIAPPTGNVFEYTANLEAPGVSFINCTLLGTQVGSSILTSQGFPTFNFFNCSLIENALNACNLITFPGGVRLPVLYFRNCRIWVNSATALVIPDETDLQFYMSECSYRTMINLSAATDTFFALEANECTFEWDGASNEPLVNFGALEGYLSIHSSRYVGGSGPFSVSTSGAANSTSIITDTYFTDTLNLNSTCNDEYYNCTFFTGAATAIAMNSSTDVILSNCVINTSANPCISGTGAGTLILNSLTFLNNSSLAGTLTINPQNSFFNTGARFITTTAGSTESLTVSNTDNTAANASSAAVIASVGGTTQVGDPYSQWSIGSTRSYSIGPDTSDASQILKISTAATNSTPSSGTLLCSFKPTATNNGVVSFYGGQVVHLTNPAAYPYTVLETDYVVFVNTTSARSVILDTSAVNAQMVTIKDRTGSAATNNITITATVGTIDGAASYIINSDFGSVTVVNDAVSTNWVII